MDSHELDEQRQIVNRLKRAHGQLGSLITRVERGDSCKDIVTQLAAVSSALDKAGFVIISSTLRGCINNPDSDMTPEEVEKLFLTLS